NVLVQRGDDLLREFSVVKRPTHEPCVVVPATREALRAYAVFFSRKLLPDSVERPGIVVPVDRAGQRRTIRKEHRPDVQVMKTVLAAQTRQMLPIDLQRVAARVIALHPDVVIA